MAGRTPDAWRARRAPCRGASIRAGRGSPSPGRPDPAPSSMALARMTSSSAVSSGTRAISRRYEARRNPPYRDRRRRPRPPPHPRRPDRARVKQTSGWTNRPISRGDLIELLGPLHGVGRIDVVGSRGVSELDQGAPVTGRARTAMRSPPVVSRVVAVPIRHGDRRRVRHRHLPNTRDGVSSVDTPLQPVSYPKTVALATSLAGAGASPGPRHRGGVTETASAACRDCSRFGGLRGSPPDQVPRLHVALALDRDGAARLELELVAEQLVGRARDLDPPGRARGTPSGSPC